MHATCPRFQPGRQQNAFTVTELVVLLAVIALLICIRVPALAKATGQTKRAQCASNLRQFTSAMLILASENDDNFPTQSVGYWAWDIPAAVGTFVERTGSKWTVMYCPGRASRFSDRDNLQLYNYSSQYRVLGYANTLPGNSTLSQSNANPTLTPPSVQVGFNQYSTSPAAQRVLLADATISGTGENNPAYNYNYVNIVGGYPLPHLTAHLAGRFPAGGNLGMLDGHVEWRKFADMTPRTVSASPTFWW
jgi:prepilin-type processing-associated H-X9-DG protein